MLKLCTVTKVKMLFLVLVYVFHFNLFEFSAAILEKGLLAFPATAEDASSAQFHSLTRPMDANDGLFIDKGGLR